MKPAFSRKTAESRKILLEFNIRSFYLIRFLELHFSRVVYYLQNSFFVFTYTRL